MKTVKILIGSLIFLSLTAAADFTTVSRAYEVTLSDFTVPATPSSGVIFRECVDCEAMTVRVTPRTRYFINGKTVTLKEFRRQIFQVRDRANELVIVKHHVESDTVESVSVSL